MKILAFGEVMLRYTVPEHMLLEQSDTVLMSTVGTGVNLLGSLSHLGYETGMITQVPDNSLGKKAVADLRKLGIDDSLVGYTNGYLGSFFVELGHGSRPQRVTYQDRLSSSFCITGPDEYDFNSALEGVDYVHICGIALSLTKETRSAALELAKVAHKKGVKVCFDFNYRMGLNENNSHQMMKELYQEMLEYVDIAFGSKRDLTDLLDYAEIKESDLYAKFSADYDIEYFAGSNRKSDEHKRYFQGFIAHNGQLYKSKLREVKVLDRIGSGDAFASGVITGLIENWKYEDTLRFAVANSVLTQESLNDTPLFDKEDIFDYLACDGKNELIR
ncbi:sugar kinase [Companilactobacillus allii]|uniref:2-keto-3-deoxygluconate kinase n=1 Tax=Companilactobacillus allii TaxID=1847728 RepID=A0A1P8Q0J1_9LACO|nr:sugar kinase [Companilactobacillus allii]APX71319.1 2-keto-3-deoxygluconate kinase [Companilactobacillus allii]USQ68400.1 sugar kinase [Companilactobacillus allii]